MPADSYKPKVLVSTLDLPESDWLEYRRRGIGGSDASAIFGVSPFRTARDLYYDKLKIASFEDDNANWVQKEVGHLLEDLVAKIFHEKTGFRVYQIKKMFYHPVYSFMLADVDYFIELPNGKTAILEIKTTNYNAKDNWWIDGVECVPVYYELQGRHYMCVMNLDEVYFCCLYGNNENEVIIRHITRDKDYEDELIGLESNFWHNHIQRHIPPPYEEEDGELIIESARRHYGPADPNLPNVELSASHGIGIERFLELQQQKSECNAQIKQIESEMKRLQGRIIAEMGKEVLGIRDGSCSIYASIKVDKTQTSLTKMLRLSPEELRRLRSCNGGKHMLLWLQYEKAIGQRIPDETIKWMLSHDMLPEKLKFAPPQMSVEQIHHYLQRNMQREKMRLSEVITTWSDYLSMAARLGYDLNDEIIYRTNKLKLRHDQLVEIIEQENMMLQAGEILRDYPHVEEHMRSVKATYEYGDENYTVLVPDRIEDILNEGRNLHHCVDKQDRYWDRLERKESYVFFLRRTNNIEQSYYTLEVEPGGTIRQKRTMYDRQEDDIEEATEFLQKWQKEIRKRLTKEDYALAEKSRILRLENFKQLRKDNVIINTGHLQGAKLVDVLMADLMIAA